jgi:hypothetical protein
MLSFTLRRARAVTMQFIESILTNLLAANCMVYG